jgi:hypothetical protein
MCGYRIPLYRLLESESTELWARVRHWLVKDLEIVKDSAIKALGSKDFERWRELLLQGEWDEAHELTLEKLEGSSQAGHSDPADWWKG